MAGIDTSVYQNFRPADLFGSIQKGMNMRDQIEQKKLEAQDRQNQAAVQQAYQAGIVQNPDGSTSYDMKKVQGNLAALSGNPLAGKAVFDLSQNIYNQQQTATNEAEAKRRWEEENKRAWAQVNATRENAAATKREKNDQRIDTDVQKLSKEIAGVQDMTNALDEVENELGFGLERAVSADGKLQVDGKPRDLPGVSIPGLGRYSFYDDKAQRLQSSMGKVFNTVLKDRSGAAVSNSEMERLKTEFGEGKFNTEAQMVDALQRYKRATQQEMKNREAGFRPEVVQRYSEQGGRVSSLRGRPSDPIRPRNDVAKTFKTNEIEW